MVPNSDTIIGRLYARLTDWISLAEFEQALADYFSEPRPAVELADYRAKRGVVKKLRDEVAPVLHHVKFVKAKGDIRFELSSDVPDCWFRDNPNAAPRGLEVTVAQSREQQRLGQEMNKKREWSRDISAYRTTPRKRFSRNAWPALASCTVRKAR